MKTYEYIKPSKFPYIKTDKGLEYKPEIVFTCQAKSIEEADKMAEAQGHKVQSLECQISLTV